MLIDFSTAIRDFDGKEIEDGGVVTLRSLSINALLAPLADASGRPEQLPGTEKVRLATLAQAIHTSAEKLDFKAEDITLLKERIGRAYSPLIVMQAWKLLEGEEL
jgi:hypothetical protein